MTREELEAVVKLAVAATINELKPSTGNAGRLLKAAEEAFKFVQEPEEMTAEDYQIIHGWGGQGA